MPIDKFTTDKYVGQEEELLEYVTVIADKFHPDMEIQEDGSSVLLPSQSPYQFMQRYNAGKLNVFFNYDNYMRNDNIDSIQAIIKALGIDSDKFWYLLLFISDYVSGKALNTWKFNDTSKGEITKFIEMVRLNEADFNDAIGFSHKLPMTLSLQVKGKRLIIDNPNTISFMAAFCEEVLAEVSEHGLFNQARFEPNGYNTSDSVQIWLFTQMLLYFFEAYPQFDNQRGKSGDTPKSKLLFISKLVYFTKLTRNEAYNDNDDNIKKIIKQYKDTKINTINPIYG